MNFRVINGVETVELSAAERRALEKALPIVDTLKRKADDKDIKSCGIHAFGAIEVILSRLCGVAPAASQDDLEPDA